MRTAEAVLVDRLHGGAAVDDRDLLPRTVVELHLDPAVAEDVDHLRLAVTAQVTVPVVGRHDRDAQPTSDRVGRDEVALRRDRLVRGHDARRRLLQGEPVDEAVGEADQHPVPVDLQDLTDPTLGVAAVVLAARPDLDGLADLGVLATQEVEGGRVGLRDDQQQVAAVAAVAVAELVPDAVVQQDVGPAVTTGATLGHAGDGPQHAVEITARDHHTLQDLEVLDQDRTRLDTVHDVPPSRLVVVDDLVDGGDQPVDVRHRVVHVEAGAGRPGRQSVELVEQGLGAEHARPDADVAVAELGGQVHVLDPPTVGDVGVIEGERDQAHGAVVPGAGAEQLDVGDLRQLGPGVLAEAADVGLHTVQPAGQVVEVVAGRRQRDHAGHVLRTGLEPGGHGLEPGAVGGHAGDHVPAAQHRPHLVETRGGDVEPAGAHRAQHLVAAEGVEVAPDLLDVDRHVPGRLRAVHEDRRAVVVGHAGDELHRVEGGRHVRHVADADQLHSTALELLLEVIDPQHGVAPAQLDELELDADLVPQLEPRHDVRVVLRHGGHDDVAGLEVLARPGEGDDVDAHGGPGREDQGRGVGGSDEERDALPGRLVRFGGVLGHRVQRAAGRGVAVDVVADLGLDDGVRLLARGAAVEVHETFGLAEQRELVANLHHLTSCQGLCSVLLASYFFLRTSLFS